MGRVDFARELVNAGFASRGGNASAFLRMIRAMAPEGGAGISRQAMVNWRAGRNEIPAPVLALLRVLAAMPEQQRTEMIKPFLTPRGR